MRTCWNSSGLGVDRAMAVRPDAWRTGGLGLALLAITSAIVLAVGGLQPASADPAACTEVAGTATCTGDQSQGVASGGDDFSSADTVLHVYPTGSITPAADTNGILFSGDTSVLIDSYLGRHQAIIINGYGDGVLGVAPGNVEIYHSGSIYNAFRGINGRSTGGNVTIDASGRIVNATEAAVNGFADSGSVSIAYHGSIINAQNRGISATAGNGDVDIWATGDISSVNQAIYAFGGKRLGRHPRRGDIIHRAATPSPARH